MAWGSWGPPSHTNNTELPYSFRMVIKLPHHALQIRRSRPIRLNSRCSLKLEPRARPGWGSFLQAWSSVTLAASSCERSHGHLACWLIAVRRHAVRRGAQTAPFLQTEAVQNLGKHGSGSANHSNEECLSVESANTGLAPPYSPAHPAFF